MGQQPILEMDQLLINDSIYSIANLYVIVNFIGDNIIINKIVGKY